MHQPVDLFMPSQVAIHTFPVLSPCIATHSNEVNIDILQWLLNQKGMLFFLLSQNIYHLNHSYWVKGLSYFFLLKVVLLFFFYVILVFFSVGNKTSVSLKNLILIWFLDEWTFFFLFWTNSMIVLSVWMKLEFLKWIKTFFFSKTKEYVK